MTNFPGGKFSLSDPTAEIETISVTPSCLRAFDYQKLDPKSRKGFPIRLNHYQTDISKIKRDLEWAPTFDLINGLKDSFVKDFNNKKSEEFDENSDHILFNS